METLIVLEKSKVGDMMLDEKKKGIGLPVIRETTFRGLPINIEFDKGMTASGKEPSGRPWKVTYKHPYGEIAQTLGRDGDPVDVYLGPNIDSDLVCIVHQVKPNGKYDEDKVFLGFDSMLDAMQCYFEHGPQWGFGSMSSMLFGSFLHGYLTATKPLADSMPPRAPDAIHFIQGA
jgi:hypothetical protein